MKRTLLPVAVSLAWAVAGNAAFNPVPLDPSSFNQDVVVSLTGSTPIIPGSATTASMDGGIANNGDTWNEQGYFRQDTHVGLPPAGTTIQAQFDATNTVASDHRYTLAPSYTAPNAIMLDAGYFTNANFTLTTPAAYQALSFLTSGGNGGAIFQYTVQHQDGTQEVGTTNSADWFSVPNGIVLIADGRVNAQSFTLDNQNSGNPRLYAIDVRLSGSSSPVTNINVKYVGGNASGHSCIMAISGTPTGGTANTYNPILGTGYTADIVVEASAPPRWDQVPGAAPPDGTYPAGLGITATMDGGTVADANGHFMGDTWFPQGYYVRSNSFGVPSDGATFASISASDHQYRMPTGPGVYLDADNTSAQMILSSPAAYSALSLVGASGGGACNVQLTVNFNDSSTEVHTIAIPDWFGGANPAWVANGRVNVSNGLLDNLNSGNPRLYSVDFTLTNTTTPIASLSLTYTSGGRGIIFGLSGASGTLPPIFAVQPQSVTVSPGGSVSFTASASSTVPLTYQWQKGTNGLFINLGGQNNATLSIASAADADDADYRVVAANVAGSATSTVAVLTVLSPLPAITLPTDPITAYQPLGGTSPDAENVTHAIDGYTQKYLNGGNGDNPLDVPVGFTVTPSKGRTFLKVIRFYTANDAPERDPANYIVQGSNDRGVTWSLVASNLLTLPDARNPGGNIPIDPTTNALKQVRLDNNNSYAIYRVYFTRVKGISNLMQIGEVEMLGTVDSAGYPNLSLEPTNTMVYVNSPATLYATATGNPTPTFQWLRNGTVIPGATQSTLQFPTAQFGDIANYQVVVANSLQSITSSVARLTVISTNTDVTMPSDTITEYGDASGTRWPATDRQPANAIDDSFAKYQNGGSGFSADAGFPPFQGPVGLIIAPASGATWVTGIRIYTADGNPERDPGDFALYGSNDSGTNWTLIANSALNLPLERNPASAFFGPFDLNTGAPNALQEVLFSNTKTYTSYKVQFNHTRDDNAANSLQIGELELLAGSGVPLSFERLPSGQLELQWSQGTLLESTSLTGPWTTNTSSSPLIVSPTGPQKFYKLLVQ